MARNRKHFQEMADVRAAEAGALIAAGLWDGAYYLAGYAVEFALKACILARIEREGIIFDDGRKTFGEECWTHDLKKLRGLAGLGDVWKAEAPTGSTLEVNWRTVKDWTEARRYDRSSRSDAEALCKAITDPNDGVLTWVRKHW